MLVPHRFGRPFRRSLSRRRRRAPAAPQVKTQAPGFYRMMLGDFEITALSDGILDLQVGQAAHQHHARGSPRPARSVRSRRTVPTSVNAYLVNTGSKLVLIDAGAGQAVRADARQPAGQPRRRRLQAGAGRCGADHPHARRPRRRPGRRRQDRLSQRHRPCRSARRRLLARQGAARQGARGDEGFLPAARRRRSIPTPAPAASRPSTARPSSSRASARSPRRATRPGTASTRSNRRARSWCSGAT